MLLYSSQSLLFFYAKCQYVIILGVAICVRTSFYFVPDIHWRETLVAIGLTSLPAFFFGILQELLRFQSFTAKNTPHIPCVYESFSNIFCNLPRCAFCSTTALHCQDFKGAWPCAVNLSFETLLTQVDKLVVQSSSPSSTTTEANCQKLRALSLLRLSHQNIGLCVMLIAHGT